MADEQVPARDYSENNHNIRIKLNLGIVDHDAVNHSAVDYNCNSQIPKSSRKRKRSSNSVPPTPSISGSTPDIGNNAKRPYPPPAIGRPPSRIACRMPSSVTSGELSKMSLSQYESIFDPVQPSLTASESIVDRNLRRLLSGRELNVAWDHESAVKRMPSSFSSTELLQASSSDFEKYVTEVLASLSHTEQVIAKTIHRRLRNRESADVSRKRQKVKNDQFSELQKQYRSVKEKSDNLEIKCLMLTGRNDELEKERVMMLNELKYFKFLFSMMEGQQQENNI